MPFNPGIEVFVVWDDEGFKKTAWVTVIEDDGRILRFSTEFNEFAIPWSKIQKVKVRRRAERMRGGEDGETIK